MREWDVLQDTGSMQPSPKIAACELWLRMPDRQDRVILTASRVSKVRGMKIDWLHPSEEAYYRSLWASKRQDSYLSGRFAAKHAVSEWVGGMSFNDIAIQPGIFGQPIVIANGYSNIQVSITHCDDGAAALAFDESLLLGIDMEQIRPDRLAVLLSQLTDREHETVKRLPYVKEASLTMIWSVKEALSKALKTGLTVSAHFYETSQLQVHSHLVYGCFTHFPQYRFCAFVAGSYTYAIVYPRQAALIAPFRRSPLLFSALAHHLRFDDDLYSKARR